MIEKLKAGNEAWIEKINAEDPTFFSKMAVGQSPEILWIGCSDSRAPANEITGTQAGEIFVHRNIANMVVHSDMNLLSVLDYAGARLSEQPIHKISGDCPLRMWGSQSSYGWTSAWTGRQLDPTY